MSRNIPLYNKEAVESKWKLIWNQESLNTENYNVKNISKKGKMILAMFPYPSGKLHMGHVRVYTITDCIARWQKLVSHNDSNPDIIIQPMGWDSFGLPAENAAIQHGIHPEEWTRSNIETMKSQMKSLSLDIDWSREIMTHHPSYYMWTQWLFIQLYRHGLAYQADGLVNWDPVDKTVLANEQVDDKGRSWRSGAQVVKKKQKQWYFKITQYADRLYDDLDILKKWPQKIKEMQQNWIRRIPGFSVAFQFKDKCNNLMNLDVYTKCPEVIHGVTFIAIAPEHSIVNEDIIPNSNWKQVQSFLNDTLDSSIRTDKYGVFTGLYASLKQKNGSSYILNNIPIYVANYVLNEVGKGAVMGVPAHSIPDYEFAKKYNIPIHSVLDSTNLPSLLPGRMNLPNHLEFHQISSLDMRERIKEHIPIESTYRYRLRDWLVSRQRYWGAPIPIIYCDTCNIVPIPEKDLPVLLPSNNNDINENMEAYKLSKL